MKRNKIKIMVEDRYTNHPNQRYITLSKSYSALYSKISKDVVSWVKFTAHFKLNANFCNKIKFWQDRLKFYITCNLTISVKYSKYW